MSGGCWRNGIIGLASGVISNENQLKMAKISMSMKLVCGNQ